MKRTQIQLPDALFEAARDVAESKEISLAELVRRGLEYMIATSPAQQSQSVTWTLPAPHPLNADDPFQHEGWRADLHTTRLHVAEEKTPYRPGDPT